MTIGCRFSNLHAAEFNYYDVTQLLRRARLEYYEQNCAVDSVTKKCAGPTAECRKAMLGILGTELRSNCACKGTELTQLYDCLGWQRLLWVNPCVGELILSSSSFFFSFFSFFFPVKQFHPPKRRFVEF